MQHVLKVLLIVLTVVVSGAIGARWPLLGGILISAPVKIPFATWWVYDESGGDAARTARFLDGALWGLVPTALFVLVTRLAVQRGLSLRVAFSIGFGVWLVVVLAQRQWADTW